MHMPSHSTIKQHKKHPAHMTGCSGQPLASEGLAATPRAAHKQTAALHAPLLAGVLPAVQQLAARAAVHQHSHGAHTCCTSTHPGKTDEE
jgi:hypothetical protein